MDIFQIVLTLIMFVLLVIPTGKYIYKVINNKRSFVDPVMDKVDNTIYKITGITKEEMTWKQYAVAFIVSNMVMTLMAYVVLRVQGVHFLNPNGNKAMDASLIFNTIFSFMTNTNLQHYSGEWGLSYLSQMIVITFFMFTSAASGFAVAAAFIRGITGKTKMLGNFFVDLVRVTTRVLIPFSIIIAILLMGQGVPQSFSANKVITTIEGTKQVIGLGPVASFEAIKHLGTNGGGFFGANSSHPFENPTPITNLIEMLSMMLIPGAIVYCFGLMVKNKKQGWAIFAAMSILFVLSLVVCFNAEKAGNPAIANLNLSQAMGNMEGKEIRFGLPGSTLFTTVTTAFTTGSVNNMHDSLTPLGGMVPLWQMMLNVVFGGEGVGFMNMIMYAILTVFLCGLMVGRTPEFLGKKIEAKEIKLISLAILIHPFIILVPSSIAVLTSQGLAGITNSGFHGLTQVLYEFTSSAANNGSGFEGLADNTMFWNLSTGLVMYAGRFFAMVILLAVAGSLAAKKSVAESNSTFKTDNTTFTIILVFIVLIIGALTFMPAVVLGPIAEHLMQ
ncbi:potassium-transporting ATPase subunit KdpA [Clostridium sp. CF012]|uniref:potassium-transporting ATPase subunit KdpA n=1 Tax=Clostridium sp. CF012 TaxID=2843319 RepID=UPI001C0C7100|nr:potassium-transporting ATPase subunit KdpA [Clostridium sp. CF012]MBU3146163.1 potassium-transporting ATPase subunit KdpA [Clostridium sp. CF012]